MKGRMVRVKNRKPPNNKKVGKVIHAFKDSNKIWISIIDYPDDERYVAVDGVDEIEVVRSIKCLTKLEVK